ncbi:MAG: hypothetical protein IH605_18445, partial [Burkholderiales bacterium]|nr:hypothetical protein [Burkholderiales bacterium]
MLPAGKASADTLTRLAPLLAKGDVIVDGANANYKDSMRRAMLAPMRPKPIMPMRGVRFISNAAPCLSRSAL